MLNNIGSKTLNTKRLILRPFKLDDATAMFNNWCQDTRVTEYLSWLPHKDIDETIRVLKMWVEDYQKPHTYHYAIVEKATDNLIGSIGCVDFKERLEACEVGYCISYEAWGKGYMSEALKELLTFLFEDVGVRRVYARHALVNPGSGKVMEKAEMRFEGSHRESFKTHDGKFVDMAHYSILKKDYYKQYKGDDHE